MTTKGTHARLGRSVFRLSAVISVRDRLSPDLRPLGKIRVIIMDTLAEATLNRSGYYLLCDLPPGSYNVQIVSDLYSSEQRMIQIPSPEQQPPMLSIDLAPGPAYPFPHDLALLRGLVNGKNGKPVPNVGIQSIIMQPQSTVKARLDGAVDEGSPVLSIKNIQGSLAAGDVLLIKDTDPGKSEFCRMAAPVPTHGPYPIKAPVRFKHADKTPLHLLEPYLILHARTTEKGEWVIPVPNMKAAVLFATVLIEEPGMPQPIQRDAAIAEGSVTSLGVISLYP